MENLLSEDQGKLLGVILILVGIAVFLAVSMEVNDDVRIKTT